MGIRGAWSLLSNDPRRFGETWSCANNESIVWIDGPSLLFFLALQPKFERIEMFHVHLNQRGQASPASIHRRTNNFIAALLPLAEEVHIVMDGLCGPSKISTQIARMKVAAQIADGAARSTSASQNCNVISILAEWTMVDAIQKMCQSNSNLRLHRPVCGEAETFIDESLARYHDTRGVVIFSNDTDFLLYAHCPGFLPFSSLQFTPSVGNTMTLSGFHYLSEKFTRAFFFKNGRDSLILSTVAGLAGCDYDDETLKAARVIVVKSKVGGLRVKHQSKPTSRMNLTAVIRYVSHYLQQGSQWLDFLIQSFDNPLLRESLRHVHEAYFAEQPKLDDERQNTIETMRLLRGDFYCRPLIEKWASSNRNTRPKMLRGRHKKRRMMNSQTAEDQVRKDLILTEFWDLSEITPVLDYKTICEQLDKQSAWTLPNFRRLRTLLYRAINATSSSTVTEWRRVSSNDGIDYKQVNVTTNSAEIDSKWNISLRQAISVHGRLLSAIAIAASLLPHEIKWLWLLLVSTPPLLCIDYGTELKIDLHPKVMNLISLAYLHAHLAIELIDEERTQNERYQAHGTCLERLDELIGSWIWSIIADMDPSNLPGQFFEAAEKRFDGQMIDIWRTNLEPYLSIELATLNIV